MKVIQRVETKFHNFYCGWGSLEFEDVNGNKISIDISDDQILKMADKVNDKARQIREEREVLEEKANSGE